MRWTTLTILSLALASAASAAPMAYEGFNPHYSRALRVRA
jgi:hypothetical protein